MKILNRVNPNSSHHTHKKWYFDENCKVKTKEEKHWNVIGKIVSRRVMG